MIITVDQIQDIDLRGKIIIFPTDTVYGVGCLYDDLVAIDRIYRLKDRDYSKPMAILAADIPSTLPLLEVTEDFMDLARKYWPGALTLIAKRSDLVSSLASAGADTVGVRVPNHELSLALLRHFGPMVVTSVNLSGEPSILKFSDILKYEKRVDYIIDGGDLEGVASTVYDVQNQEVLRQGSLIIEK
ncbi:MAG: threonylcarbamoyl-AMP synthase [Bacilli bacterium]|nr:threonylcarbamoyl-AMP synthase [Bacilli bacterium]